MKSALAKKFALSDEEMEPLIDRTGQEIKLKTVLDDSFLMHKIPVDCIPTEFPLPCPLYAKIATRYVMFRQKDDHISEERIKNFKQMGEGFIFVPKIFWKSLTKGMENHTLPASASAEDRIRYMRGLLLVYNEEISQLNTTPPPNLFKKLRGLADILAEEIIRNPQSALLHLRQKSHHAQYFINHAVNTAIYSTLISNSLKYPLGDIQQVTYGCLIHDIGNVFISPAILHKEGKLTPEEFDIMKTHTIEGAELLKKIGTPPAIVLMALEHHERNDGNGYPQRLSGKQISSFAKICAIADVYDAITSNRPHQGKLDSEEAMRRMRSEEGLFDPDFLGKISFSFK